MRWSGVADPRYDDWVALVVPADADLSYSAPAKWKYAAGDVRHVDTGSGELRYGWVARVRGGRPGAGTHRPGHLCVTAAAAGQQQRSPTSCGNPLR